jgi:hypothetical protein
MFIAGQLLFNHERQHKRLVFYVVIGWLNDRGRFRRWHVGWQHIITNLIKRKILLLHVYRIAAVQAWQVERITRLVDRSVGLVE